MSTTLAAADFDEGEFISPNSGLTFKDGKVSSSTRNPVCGPGLTPIRDTSCCCHPLNGAPYLRPGPRCAMAMMGMAPSVLCDEL